MQLFEQTVSADQVKGIVSELVDQSVYFTVEPMPDDQYEISVKPEAAGLLQSVCITPR
ncbi:MAG: hypothetical protein V7752_21610 [Halopseudomonas sp.]